MPPVGFEPTISAGERPQTYALDRAVTGTGKEKVNSDKILSDRAVTGTGKEKINSDKILSDRAVTGTGKEKINSDKILSQSSK